MIRFGIPLVRDEDSEKEDDSVKSLENVVPTPPSPPKSFVTTIKVGAGADQKMMSIKDWQHKSATLGRIPKKG
jgi:hypothetical protein